MALIDQIISEIQSIPLDNSGNLTLKSDNFQSDFMGSFFSKLLLATSISLSAAAKTPGTQEITVTGTADIFGYKSLSLSINFSVQNNEVVGTVVGTFAPSKQVSLPLLTWLQVGSIVLTTSISETFQLTTLDFKMNLLLQGTSDNIPIEITRLPGTEWQLDIAEGTNQGITGTEIVEILGGQTLESFVPQSLSSVLSGFQINGIEAIIDTEQKTVSYLTTGLSVTNGWDIAPKVSLKPGLQLNLSLINPADSANRLTVANINATFLLGGVTVPITMGATFGSTNLWTFGIQPGESVTLPSFSDLLGLAGGQDFLDSLPTGLSQIPQIEIDTLMVEFDPDNKQLTLLSFAIQTASTWKIIDNYFEIQKLSFAFDITNLTDPTTRLILGDMQAIFLIDNTIPLMCEIKKTQENPDWTIITGLPPGKTLNLTQVARSLFEGKITIPSDAPDFAFSVLQITVVPTKKSFEFAARSAGEWKIVEKFSIKTFDLDFKRDPSQANNPITGHIAATLDIIDVTINLKASLNDTPGGGWQFTGDTGTSSVPIGQLIQELANIFGDITLPPVLTGFYIENLKVSFNTATKNFTFTCDLKDTAYPNFDFVIDIEITNNNDGTYKKHFEGTLHYKSEKFTMDFDLTFDEVKSTNPTSTTSTMKASYNATTPPTLVDFLEAVSGDLGFSSDLPAELNFNAELDSLVFEWIKKDNDAAKIEAAGLFKLTIDSTVWNFYLSYSNASYFENLGANTRALGASGSPAYVFGISFSGVLDLEKLPLVGKIPGVGDYSIDKLGFYYTDAVFTKDNNKLIFAVAELGTNTPLAPNPSAAFLSQPQFSLLALFGKKNESSASPNALPLGQTTGTSTKSLAAVAGDAPSNQGTFAQNQATSNKPIVWLPINKTLGPVELDKVGLSYEKPPEDETGELGIVGLYISGAFTLAGLSMVLDRLGITFPIPKPGGSIQNPLSQVGFHLGGMFLEYKEPGLEIAGGFISIPGPTTNMVGEFIFQAGPYGLQGYGGYANDIGHPSLFIFLHLNAPIGGPPFFFINGVSGGFGVNRGFKLPSFSELPNYPLLPSGSSIPTAGDLGGKTSQEKLTLLTNSLLSLADYFPVENGEYWFAVGLDVSCFEMIEVSAILAIAFGVELEIAVIGSASLTLPVKEPEPIAFIQIDFEVSYSSSNSLLAVMGVITPSSFVFDGLVHISGGFAFYTWFDGPHSGDFVVTIGGYNNHYKKPEQYPDVPRMELRAGIGIVNMVGQSYFALTPQAIMAGLDFKATAELGPISAWFYAGVDFFIGWKPFHYEAEAHIQIGVSFTINLGFVKTKISIQVGVALEIWGPEFGGKAVIDLAIISFTISFGAEPKEAPLLDWDSFADFLPSVPAPSQSSGAMLAMAAAAPSDNNKPLVNILVKDGLVKAFAEGQEVDGLNWIVDANHFDIRTHSTAPCTQVVYNSKNLPSDYKYFTPDNLSDQINSALHSTQEPPFFVYQAPDTGAKWNEIAYGIPPMGLTNISSTHTVTIQKLPIVNNAIGVDDIIITLNTDGVPAALWGNQPVSKNMVNSDKTVIPNALTELQFTPMLWFPSRTTFIAYYYLVFNTNDLFLEQDTAPTINPATFSNPQTIYQNMQNGTAFSQTLGVRNKIVNSLINLGFDSLKPENSDKLSTQDYVDDPLLTYMSSTNETNFGS